MVAPEYTAGELAWLLVAWLLVLGLIARRALQEADATDDLDDDVKT